MKKVIKEAHKNFIDHAKGKIKLKTSAYYIRDEYAERYEALKLPDGWAITFADGVVSWSSNDCYSDKHTASRRIINGKAYKIGEEPK